MKTSQMLQETFRIENKRTKTVPPSEIKPTKTSVYREANLYEKIRDFEIKKISDLAAGNGDSVEYKKYLQAEMTKMEDEERLKREKLHESVIEGRSKAIKALEGRKEANERIGAERKAEKERIMSEVSSNLASKLEKTNEFKKECLKVREGVREAKAEIEARKRQQKIEDQKEFERQKEQTQKQNSLLLDNKQRLIAKIKLRESMPGCPQRHDLTETGNHGLLEEMSVVELRERLALMREEEGVERREKAEKLRQRKAEEKRIVDEKMELINKYRQIIK